MTVNLPLLWMSVSLYWPCDWEGDMSRLHPAPHTKTAEIGANLTIIMNKWEQQDRLVPYLSVYLLWLPQILSDRVGHIDPSIHSIIGSILEQWEWFCSFSFSSLHSVCCTHLSKSIHVGKQCSAHVLHPLLLLPFFCLCYCATRRHM